LTIFHGGGLPCLSAHPHSSAANELFSHASDVRPVVTLGPALRDVGKGKKPLLAADEHG
jgi:hypothetical protein